MPVGMLFPLLILAVPLTDPETLAAQAVVDHPSLSAQQAQTQALQAQVQAADAWMDPMLSVELSNLSVRTGDLSHPMSGVQLRFSQTLPAPGLSAAQVQVAEQSVAVAALQEQEAALQLQVAVHGLWWRVALAQHLETLTVEQIQRTEELAEVVRTRYETGQTGQSAVLRMTLLHDRLVDDQAELAAQQVQGRAALHGVVSAPVEADFALPAQALAAPKELSPPSAWDRPALEGLWQQEALSASKAELAVAQGRPDVSVWAGYRVRTQAVAGDDLASVGVSVPLPHGSRERARAQAEQARLEGSAAASQALALEEQLLAQAQGALSRWQRAEEKARIYETELLPAARAVLETTRNDYQLGRADFASLYEAEVALLNLERAHAAALAETFLQRAQIAGLTGLWETQ